MSKLLAKELIIAIQLLPKKEMILKINYRPENECLFLEFCSDESLGILEEYLFSRVLNNG
jgi:hypothetical protein